MNRKLSRSLAALGILIVAGGGLVLASSAVRTRLLLVGQKLTGNLSDVRWRDFPKLMVPHSGYNMEALSQTRSGAVSLRLPGELAVDTAEGSRLFAARCSQCHGAQGEGKIGPTLISGQLRHGASDWAMYSAIRNGITNTAMRPMGLSFGEAWQVVGVLRARQWARAGSLTSSIPARSRPVNDSDLVAGDRQEDEWLNWSGGLSGRRHRSAPDLTEASLNRMRLSWAFQLPPDPASSQSTPIAVGRLLIVTAAEDVIALDQASGDVVWRFHRSLPPRISVCCQRANRGVAVFDSLVFVGTLDAHLVALSLQSGKVKWEAEVGTPEQGLSITGAPLVADGRVIVGIGGGEFGVRGFLDAYDAKSGKRLWRFHTIPAQGEPGSETWPTGSLARGGGATWVTGAFDPERHLLYWGTGNPAPGMAPDIRPGDNLYTCSVVALDVRTGEMRWYYQFTPNDSHDWDAAQTPVLVDADWNGKPRALILWANRNGFFYALDRETGQFLRGSPFVKQTWNHGFDPDGRPRVARGTQPTPGGTQVYPGASVAANWWPASYSPELNLLFIATREVGGIFVRGPSLNNETGYTGGIWMPIDDGERTFLALEPESGKIRWRAPAPHSLEPGATAGTLSIGDRLVLSGGGTELVALDAKTGRLVWKQNLGAPILSAPMVFRVDGRPRIAVIAGSVLFVLGLDDGRPASTPLH